MESKKEQFKKTYMTERGIFGYMDVMEISEKELNDPNALILDLGSGAKQNFARDIQDLGFKAKVISVDPRLGLEENEDLALMPSSEQNERLVGRKKSMPGTVAAIGEELPFKGESFHKIFALFSVPYYLEQENEIYQNLTEMIRVLRPGGTIKIFPILGNQVKIIEKFLNKQKDIEFSLQIRGDEDEKDSQEPVNDRFLVIRKKMEKE